MKKTLNMKVNDENVEIVVAPGDTLLKVLREKLYLTGTKEGCDVGVCGACSVIMDGKVVNSCLVPALSARGSRVYTIEGLGERNNLHPLQKNFINEGAIQCGFCTPGMIMAAKALLDKSTDPSEEEIKEAIGGNICRCTGYVSIERAVKKAAKEVG